MDQNLAIIIPAYKGAYLKRTLDSLVQQTNKNFSVYIGDDCSPENLPDIINQYISLLNITYKKFSDNRGKSDLISQWERCLDMIQNEEYFILFSDDDIMEANCVEMFYQALACNHIYDVYHYNIDVIDQHENITKHCNEYPQILSASEFIRLIYTYQIDARMPEFIFRTSHFNETGRFIKFDLAYRSDNATVLVCAEEKGIFSIEKAKVLWRDSGVNISSTYNISTQKRKAIATIDFFNWLEAYYTSKNQTSPLTLKERLLLTITEISSLSPNYPHSELYKLLPLIRQITHSKTILFKSKCCLFLLIHQKRKTRKLIKKLINIFLKSYK